MYKLVIAEDEEIFRKVLPLIIDWNAIGFEVAAVVENGSKALGLLKEIEVDVILTDIRMPVLNGLDLAMEVKSRFSNTKVVLLSAFNEFDYARKGIECGVYGYILKSDGEEEITGYFTRLKKTLDEEKRISLENEEFWIQRQAFFKGLLQKDANINELNAAAGQKLGINLSTGSYQVVVFELDEYSYLETSLGINTVHKIIRLVRNQLYKYVELQHKGYIACIDEKVCILWTPIKQDFDLSVQAVFGELNEELALFEENNESIQSITCAIGYAAYDLMGISNSYKRAVEVLKHKVYLGNGHIINSMDLPDEPQNNITFADEDQMAREILGVIHEGDSVKIVECLVKWENAFITKRFCERDLLFTFCIKVILTVTNDLGKMRENSGELLTKSSYIVREISKLETISSVFKCLKLFLIETVAIFNEDNKAQNRKIVDEALEYIEHNYSGQISLENVAKRVNVHPVHLSRLFSRDLGKTFRSVLTEIRVEAAKKLLVDLNYKVYEISGLVGYEKPRYFSELFRNATGLTPLQYREKYKV